MDSDITPVLEELGLTRVESGVFLSLLNKGTCQIGALVRDTGQHRGTVYNALQRLLQKGLVCAEYLNSLTQYSPNQNGFLTIIADEKNRLAQQEVAVKEISRRIKLSKQFVDDHPATQVMHGKSTFKTFFLDLFYQSRKNEETYRYLGNGGTVHDQMGEKYYAFSQQKKVELGAKCKVVLNEGIKKHPSLKFVAGNIRWVPSGYDFGSREMWRYDNKIVIVDWDKKPIKIQILTDPQEFRWHSTVMNAFWNDIALKRDEYLEANVWRSKTEARKI